MKRQRGEPERGARPPETRSGAEGGDSTEALARRAARLEERLRESEQRFQSIIDANADGIVLVDDHSRIRFVNPAAEELFGRPANALIGQTFGYPVDGGATTEIDIVRRGEPPIVAEMRTVETTWEGEPACVVSLRDITDRIEAESRYRELVREQGAREAAEDAARRAALVAESAGLLDASLDYRDTLPELASHLVPGLADGCAIDVAGPDGTVDRAATATAWEREPSTNGPAPPPPVVRDEVLRRGEPVLLSLDDREQAERLLVAPEKADALLGDGLAELLVAPMVAAGDTLGAIVLSRTSDHDGFVDADLQTALEVARNAAYSLKNAQLYQEASRANQAKADFLAVMSHELRTPLNAVIGYTNLLRQGLVGELNRRQSRYLERIDASSRHLLQLVEEILSFARTESGHDRIRLAPADLAELAHEAAEAIEPLAREKALAFEVELEPAEIVTDAAKVRHVMSNLLSNAVKFTEAGSVRLEVRPDGEGALVRVSDTGIGIPEDEIDRIFDPFWQVEQSQTRVAGGTGLGLSIVQRHVESLNGEIEVESEVGKGTRMTVRLPGAPPREESRPGGPG